WLATRRSMVAAARAVVVGPGKTLCARACVVQRLTVYAGCGTSGPRASGPPRSGAPGRVERTDRRWSQLRPRTAELHRDFDAWRIPRRYAAAKLAVAMPGRGAAGKSGKDEPRL